MPILFIERNGHPEATNCPMIICDVCASPIHDGQNGFAARWRGLGPGPTPRMSPTYFVHSNRSRRCLTELQHQFDEAYELMSCVA